MASNKSQSVNKTRLKRENDTRDVQKKLERRAKRRALSNPLNFSDFQQEGYVYRMVNDDPRDMGRRIAMMEELGWEKVHGAATTETDGQTGEASQMGSLVTRPVGGGVTGILMRIPSELYEEDQQYKIEERRRKEQAIYYRRNADRLGEADYRPQSLIDSAGNDELVGSYGIS